MKLQIYINLILKNQFFVPVALLCTGAITSFYYLRFIKISFFNIETKIDPETKKITVIFDRKKQRTLRLYLLFVFVICLIFLFVFSDFIFYWSHLITVKAIVI